MYIRFGPTPALLAAVRTLPLGPKVFGQRLRSWVALLLASIAAACVTSGVAAAQDVDNEGGGFTLVIENDLFSDDGQDRNYSSGLKLAFLTEARREPRWARSIADLLPGYAERLDTRFEFEIGQSMYTPRDLTRVIPDPEDRPYAGLLYASLGLISWTDEDVLDQAQIVVGVVGPSSQAGESQRWLHRQIDGAVQPQGWDSQIPDQFVGELRMRRTHRIPIAGGPQGAQMDIAPHAGFSLGNLTTSADVGAGFRVGWNLPVDFGPPRVSPSLPGSAYFITSRNAGWYLFGGVDGRYVAYSLVLDEPSAFGASVQRRPWVGDAQLGGVAYWGDLRLAYTQVWRSREFESQRSDFSQFGAISVSWRN